MCIASSSGKWMPVVVTVASYSRRAQQAASRVLLARQGGVCVFGTNGERPALVVIDRPCTMYLICLAWQHCFLEYTSPYLAEQSSLAQDMSTARAEGHTWQIMRSNSQDGTFCYRCHGRQHVGQPPSWKFQMTISLQQVIQSSSLILGACCQQQANHISCRLVCLSFSHVTLSLKLGGVNCQSSYRASFIIMLLTRYTAASLVM